MIFPSYGVALQTHPGCLLSKVLSQARVFARFGFLEKKSKKQPIGFREKWFEKTPRGKPVCVWALPVARRNGVAVVCLRPSARRSFSFCRFLTNTLSSFVMSSALFSTILPPICHLFLGASFPVVLLIVLLILLLLLRLLLLVLLLLLFSRPPPPPPRFLLLVPLSLSASISPLPPPPPPVPSLHPAFYTILFRLVLLCLCHASKVRRQSSSCLC